MVVRMRQQPRMRDGISVLNQSLDSVNTVPRDARYSDVFNSCRRSLIALRCLRDIRFKNVHNRCDLRPIRSLDSNFS